MKIMTNSVEISFWCSSSSSKMEGRRKALKGFQGGKLQDRGAERLPDRAGGLLRDRPHLGGPVPLGEAPEDHGGVRGALPGFRALPGVEEALRRVHPGRDREDAGRGGREAGRPGSGGSIRNPV